MIYKIKTGNYQGIIDIPASKSDAQRALLIAALSNVTSLLKNVGESKDERAMLDAIQTLGATITKEENGDVAVQGNFESAQFSKLFIGESGLGLRLLTAIAALKNQEIQIDGEGSLLKRNQSFFERELPKMGVKVHTDDGMLPLSICGPLQAGTYEVDGSESSQYISGLIIAFSQVMGVTVLKVKNLSSRPYVDMTLQTLKKFGVNIVENEKDVFTVVGKQMINGGNYTVDGDWSAASYWLIASALGLNIAVRGLSMGSKQADKMLLNALMQANCRVNNGVNGIEIDGTNRSSLDFDATHCPDLFPALVTYAALTNGTSRIRGVHRLSNKESDRGAVLVQEFSKLGVHISIKGDEMTIVGATKLLSSDVKSHNDHRIAMCLAIASIVSNVSISIKEAHSVEKSYPNFWKDLERLKVG